MTGCDYRQTYQVGQLVMVIVAMMTIAMAVVTTLFVIRRVGEDFAWIEVIPLTVTALASSATVPFAHGFHQ